jgi:hypothetical protein
MAFRNFRSHTEGLLSRSSNIRGVTGALALTLAGVHVGSLLPELRQGREPRQSFLSQLWA